MSLPLGPIPLEIADIAYKAARIFYPKNKDPALEFGDFIHEITIEIAKEVNDIPGDEPLMWKIACNTAIDLLRKGKYRAHRSLNEPVELDEDGHPVERLDMIVGSPGFEDEVLIRVYIEQTVPKEIIRIGWKRVCGIALSDAERKRLERFRKKCHNCS